MYLKQFQKGGQQEAKATTMAVRNTPVYRPVPHTQSHMIVNNDGGGWVYEITPMQRLERFLVMGTENNTFYQSRQEITKENTTNLTACIQADGRAVVDLIVKVSDEGRALSNDPALFALAACLGSQDKATRLAAKAVLPQVARTGTHILHFASYLENFRGWGRVAREAVADWFLQKTPTQLAYQAIKYRARDGWSLWDLMRLSHPKAANAELNEVLRWIAGKVEKAENPILAAHDTAFFCGSEDDTVHLIREFNLPRESIATQHLNSPAVWEALLEHMKPEAMLRNLNKMTALGMLTRGSDSARRVIATFSDGELLRKARLHPMRVLVGMKTYEQGHGEKGKLTWTPVKPIVDCLDAAFYLCYKGVEPTGLRHLVALDVSPSMWGPSPVAGITNAMAVAAMGLIQLETEPLCDVYGFSNRFVDLKFRRGMSLTEAMQRAKEASERWGSTDMSLPMTWARDMGLEYDTFQVYTDNEVNTGRHASQTLIQYRQWVRNRKVKFAAIATTATNMSIADPADAGSMDFVGFSADLPAALGAFFRG